MTLSGVEFLVVEPSNIHHEGTKVAKNSTFIKVTCVLLWLIECLEGIFTADLFPQGAKVFIVAELTRQIRGALRLSFRAKSRNL